MKDALESLLLPVLALAAGLLLFGLFVMIDGHDPLQAWALLFRGAFGDAFSLQNTLQRAAPLMLTALCVALPARAGLTVIGGEGALVLGGLACAALPYALPLPAGLVRQGAPGDAVDPLQRWLFERHRIEVPIIAWPDADRRLVRVSAQLYNRHDEHDALAAALREAKSTSQG